MIMLDKIYSLLTEAFKAGNRARKKESVQDTVIGIEYKPKLVLLQWVSELIDYISEYMETHKTDWSLNIEELKKFRIGRFSKELVYIGEEEYDYCHKLCDISFSLVKNNENYKGSIWLFIPKNPDDPYAYSSVVYDMNDNIVSRYEEMWDDYDTTKDRSLGKVIESFEDFFDPY